MNLPTSSAIVERSSAIEEHTCKAASATLALALALALALTLTLALTLPLTLKVLHVRRCGGSASPTGSVAASGHVDRAAAGLVSR